MLIAATILCIGNTTTKAPIALPPITLPTNRVSTILYNSATNREIIAGIENFNKTFPTLPSANNLSFTP